MGDAGSLVLGFIMVVGGIQMLQSTVSQSNEMIVLIGVMSVLMVPVLDAMRVFRIRIIAGKSPFAPDKNHLHHLVLAMGLRHSLASLTIVGISLFQVLVGYIAFLIAGALAAVISMILLFMAIVHFLNLNSALRQETGQQCLTEIKAVRE